MTRWSPPSGSETANIVVGGYTKPAQQFVHHMIFAKTTETEPGV